MAGEPFIVSAPGKVILFGEHAVVYGKAAVAASLDLRTYMVLEPLGTDTIELRFPDVDLDLALPTCDIPLLAADGQHPTAYEAQFAPLLALVPTGPPTAALLAFLCIYSQIAHQHETQTTHTSNRGFRIVARSALPVGAGLGSSASFSACLATALLKHFDFPRLTSLGPAGVANNEPLALINHWAFVAEQVTHGQPSGIDNAIAVYGGAKLYRKGQPMRDLGGFGAQRFLLVDTTVPKNTKRMVAGVADRRQKFPLVIDPVLDAIDGIASDFAQWTTAQATSAVSSPSGRIAELIAFNQQLLRLLGVSHPSLEGICTTAAQYGLAAKLTGGGGGGCALAWVPVTTPQQVISNVQQALVDQGYTCYDTGLAGPGVQACDDLTPLLALATDCDGTPSLVTATAWDAALEQLVTKSPDLASTLTWSMFKL
ncbi:Mevalonate kinase [Dimargaris verticillata]|uniref:Mevalonate kinase n=1 Tax=Dimargaris verticillata TaxID=2761393 RepID=A0A9W8EAF9_9FUNG|nr:Mevalonate kinase [Dimargaris verticillata]